jgi:deoxycytidylate deaminase
MVTMERLPVLKTAEEDDEGLTRWDVLHAEANAILKVARSTQSCEGSTCILHCHHVKSVVN